MIFTRKNRIIKEQRILIQQLEDTISEKNLEITGWKDRLQFQADAGKDFTKQVGLRVGMNPGTKNGDLFIRLDALQRNTVVLNLAREILGAVDWSLETNPTQEEIVTASMAALKVLK